jgi:hypothetical protein
MEPEKVPDIGRSYTTPTNLSNVGQRVWSLIKVAIANKQPVWSIIIIIITNERKRLGKREGDHDCAAALFDAEHK